MAHAPPLSWHTASSRRHGLHRLILVREQGVTTPSLLFSFLFLISPSLNSLFSSLPLLLYSLPVPWWVVQLVHSSSRPGPPGYEPGHDHYFLSPSLGFSLLSPIFPPLPLPLLLSLIHCLSISFSHSYSLILILSFYVSLFLTLCLSYLFSCSLFLFLSCSL